MKFTKRIADYRLKYLLYAGTCSVILVFGFAKNGFSTHSWQYWLGQLFLITAFFWLLTYVFSLRTKFIGRNGEIFKSELEKEMEDSDAKSYFSFTQADFTFCSPNSEKWKIAWSDVSQISAWVEDQIVVDDMLCIRIDLLNNRFLEFDEVTPGFSRFVSHAHRQFSCFPAGWIEKLNKTPDRVAILFKT